MTIPEEAPSGRRRTQQPQPTHAAVSDLFSAAIKAAAGKSERRINTQEPAAAASAHGLWTTSKEYGAPPPLPPENTTTGPLRTKSSSYTHAHARPAAYLQTNARDAWAVTRRVGTEALADCRRKFNRPARIGGPQTSSSGAVACSHEWATFATRALSGHPPLVLSSDSG